MKIYPPSVARIVPFRPESAVKACSAHRVHSGESTRRPDPLAWIAVALAVLALLVLLPEIV